MEEENENHHRSAHMSKVRYVKSSATLAMRKWNRAQREWCRIDEKRWEMCNPPTPASDTRVKYLYESLKGFFFFCFVKISFNFLLCRERRETRMEGKIVLKNHDDASTPYGAPWSCLPSRDFHSTQMITQKSVSRISPTRWKMKINWNVACFAKRRDYKELEHENEISVSWSDISA